MKRQIYLDHAAATPVDDSVLEAMRPYWQEQFYNPSALYLSAHKVGQDLQAARAKVASVLGARPSEIIFTAGGTEANNLAIAGVMDGFRGANVLVSSIEHESVLRAAEGYDDHVQIPVDAHGMVELEQLETLIRDTTVLVSVMYGNNEVGTIEPIRRVAVLVQDIRQRRRKAGNDLPLYLHTDACQAGNYLDLHVARLGVDMMTLNGGKLYGPKQSGVLFVASHVRLVPQIVGGGQERGLRSGTENVPAAIGFAQALELAQLARHEASDSAAALQELFITEIGRLIPNALVNGSRKQRLPNNVHVTIPGSDNERLLFALDERGILAAAGSACSASSDEPSHVLKAMGLSDADARSSLRFTFGRATTAEDVQITIRTLAEVLKS